MCLRLGVAPRTVPSGPTPRSEPPSSLRMVPPPWLWVPGQLPTRSQVSPHRRGPGGGPLGRQVALTMGDEGGNKPLQRPLALLFGGGSLCGWWAVGWPGGELLGCLEDGKKRTLSWNKGAGHSSLCPHQKGPENAPPPAHQWGSACSRWGIWWAGAAGGSCSEQSL